MVTILRNDHASDLRTLLRELVFEKLGVAAAAVRNEGAELVVDDLLDEVLATTFGSSAAETWVLLCRSRVRGLTTFVPRSRDLVEIKRIGLSRTLRGLGYSHLLLRRVEEEVCVRGFKKLIVYLSPSEDSAMAFYRSAGFAASIGEEVLPAGCPPARHRVLLIKEINPL